GLLREHRAELLVQPQPVGLHPQIELGHAMQRGAQFAGEAAQLFPPGEQGLATVQDEARSPSGQRNPARRSVTGS
ncbi:hypothetical protein, partial [Streptomyces ipomoeae]|uniref:hypothetical protein n=1 Tax=Streptomyces ipomoeae TaxID=103232 RepID=UPI001F2EC605